MHAHRPTAPADVPGTGTTGATAAAPAAPSAPAGSGLPLSSAVGGAAIRAGGGYKLPPPEIAAIVDAPAQPALSYSPDRKLVGVEAGGWGGGVGEGGRYQPKLNQTQCKAGAACVRACGRGVVVGVEAVV